MGSKYKKASLKELGVELIDCDHKTPKAVEMGIPYIGIPQMDSGRINFDAKPRLISEEDFVKWTRKANPTYGDVILSRRCNSGETVYVPKNRRFALGQNLVLLRPKGDRLFPEYLRYVVKSKEWWGEVAKYLNPGAIFESLKCADIPKFMVPEPPVEAQKKIVEILSAIEDRIELNQQTNQTLEQMAQALFKSWFVDFDPVIDNALAAGSKIPAALQHRVEIRKKAHALQQQNPNIQPLPAATQRLFPSEFEHCGDNTLGIQGWIPKGWISDVLASIAEYSTSRIDGAELTLENYISTENMLPYKQGVTEASSIPQLKTAPSFKTGDVLISNIRPYFKKIWLANRNGGRSNDVLGFQSIEPRTESYLMNLLSQDSFFDFMMTTAKGSKMPRGDKKAIMNWGVVVPPVQIREFYSRLVRDFYIANSNRVKESNSLVQLRDILLPKLISGELLVNKDIENG
ncbi:restriction endonuclease subunit S [Glaciecola sp. 2405UD65-10]|uniref:restriction endonuclease subunit S n=1 Tax=Glaciecola sp. 2405UD65-10 TaxID=3397244 RepID=UPI003B5AED98